MFNWFNWFNSNLFSQILTGAIILETGLATLLTAFGCTLAVGDTAMVCTMGTLPLWIPEWAALWLVPWLAGAAALQGLLKWGIHLFKGDTWLSGLFKPTAVISSSGAPGTVTMMQVVSRSRK